MPTTRDDETKCQSKIRCNLSKQPLNDSCQSNQGLWLSEERFSPWLVWVHVVEQNMVLNCYICNFCFISYAFCSWWFSILQCNCLIVPEAGWAVWRVFLTLCCVWPKHSHKFFLARCFVYFAVLLCITGRLSGFCVSYYNINISRADCFLFDKWLPL